MHRLRQYLASFVITPITIIVLAMLVVAVGLVAFGPSAVQAPAPIVGLILLAGIVGGVPIGQGGARGGWRNPSLADRRGEVCAANRHDIVAATAADEQTELELWRKERERRAKNGR